MSYNPGVSFFVNFYDLDPVEQDQCIYFTLKGLRCRWYCRDNTKAIEYHRRITACGINDLSLDDIIEYVRCNCCREGRAIHRDRIVNVGLLVPLAERWLEEIKTRKRAEEVQRQASRPRTPLHPAPISWNDSPASSTSASPATWTPYRATTIETPMTSPSDYRTGSSSFFNTTPSKPGQTLARVASPSYFPATPVANRFADDQARYNLRSNEVTLPTPPASVLKAKYALAALSEFQPHIEEPSSSDCVASKICDPLDNRDFETGAVYIFRRDSSPGYVKIGWTAGYVQTRLDGWSSCGYTPIKVFSAGGIPSAQRAETLSHYELIKEWRRERMCKASHCRVSHQEWFEVSNTRAIEVVSNWATFFQKAVPYDVNGSLKSMWRDVVWTLAAKGETVTSKKLLEVHEASVREEKARKAEEQKVALCDEVRVPISVKRDNQASTTVHEASSNVKHLIDRFTSIQLHPQGPSELLSRKEDVTARIKTLFGNHALRVTKPESALFSSSLLSPSPGPKLEQPPKPVLQNPFISITERTFETQDPTMDSASLSQNAPRTIRPQVSAADSIFTKLLVAKCDENTPKGDASHKNSTVMPVKTAPILRPLSTFESIIDKLPLATSGGTTSTNTLFSSVRSSTPEVDSFKTTESAMLEQFSPSRKLHYPKRAVFEGNGKTLFAHSTAKRSSALNTQSTTANNAKPSMPFIFKAASPSSSSHSENKVVSITSEELAELFPRPKLTPSGRASKVASINAVSKPLFGPRTLSKTEFGLKAESASAQEGLPSTQSTVVTPLSPISSTKLQGTSTTHTHIIPNTITRIAEKSDVPILTSGDNDKDKVEIRPEQIPLPASPFLASKHIEADAFDVWGTDLSVALARLYLEKQEDVIIVDYQVTTKPRLEYKSATFSIFDKLGNVNTNSIKSQIVEEKVAITFEVPDIKLLPTIALDPQPASQLKLQYKSPESSIFSKLGKATPSIPKPTGVETKFASVVTVTEREVAADVDARGDGDDRSDGKEGSKLGLADKLAGLSIFEKSGSSSVEFTNVVSKDVGVTGKICGGVKVTETELSLSTDVF